jgi:hypothetical protein
MAVLAVKRMEKARATAAAVAWQQGQAGLGLVAPEQPAAQPQGFARAAELAHPSKQE